MAQQMVVKLAEEWRVHLETDAAASINDVVDFVYEAQIRTSMFDADICESQYFTQQDLKGREGEEGGRGPVVGGAEVCAGSSGEGVQEC